jgi:predicted aldo/keto reductase-like oxidoreductase
MEAKAFQYTRLGSSGPKISRIAMGAMSFGEGDSGREGWPIPYEDTVPLFRQVLDLGITFWDTANGYNAGTSEESAKTSKLAVAASMSVLGLWPRAFRLITGVGGASPM